MAPVEVGGPAEEALAGEFLLEGARGQVHVGLAAAIALPEREQGRFVGHAHGVTPVGRLKV